MLIRRHTRTDNGYVHATSSEITPREAYEQRRDFLRLVAGGAAGTALAGIPANREGHGELMADAATVRWDSADDLAATIERLGPERIAAFFCEPVIGAGGVYPPPDGYLAEVRQVCREHDILFVSDEVVTGFGRIGGSWSVVSGTTMGVGVIAGRTMGGGTAIVGVGVIRGAAGCSACGYSTGVVACGACSAPRTNPCAGMCVVVAFQLVTARWP